MQLTESDRAYLAGAAGPGVQKCMQVLVNFSKAFGAPKLVNIGSAHVIPNIPLGLLETLTEGVKTLPVMTTLHPHMSALCPNAWPEMGIDTQYAQAKLPDVKRRAALFAEKGFNQTYTCYPAMVGSLPKKGDYVSWIGSGGQVLVNSTIGARCNRDGALLTLAAAITGRSPYYGLFLDCNRLAEILVSFDGLDANRLSKTELSAIGYYLGAQAKSHNIAIDGIDPELGMDYLRQIMIPLTVTGAVGVCHVLGVTPEAGTLKEAFGGRRPVKKISVDREILRRSLALYAPQSGAGEGLLSPLADVTAQRDVAPTDMVVLGCPHLSIQEIRLLAGLLTGRKIPKHKHLWIGLAHQQYSLAREMGYVATIERAGGVMASVCMSTIPDSPIPAQVNSVMTSSMKAAHYISQLNQKRLSVGVADIECCIRSLLDSTADTLQVTT
ncbi:aconitase X (plasmid) [Cedecea davisae]|uniref:aconitase X n=1 Tax=Cedecea davisae TaxID=158484 RepID=UPI00376EA64D